MVRGSPEACIVGGAGLVLLDVYGISIGRLPLKGRLDTAIEMAETPELFWAYSACLGAIGLSAMLWGLWRRMTSDG
jgi:hypothetical protein